MIRTRYWRLKMLLVPLNGLSGFMAATTELPGLVRIFFGAVSATCTPLYALINEVPRDHREDAAGAGEKPECEEEK